MMLDVLQVCGPGPHHRSVQEVCHQQQLPRHSDHPPQERGGRPRTANSLHLWFSKGERKGRFLCSKLYCFQLDEREKADFYIYSMFWWESFSS